MDPLFRNNITSTVRTLEKQSWSSNLPMGLWMGETGGVSHSGRDTVTNRFMSAFWYLDWLGTFSLYGHKGFCRQTLLGGNYGLLQNENGNIRPNPDFWAALLFNSLMKGDIINGKT